jgi:N-acetylglutamate synthase-like GNAT family acetyltransferase
MSQNANKADISLRDAQPGDAEPACALVRRSILELCKLDHGNDPMTLEGWLCNKTPQNMQFWITTPGTTCFLAEIGGELAGVGVVADYGEVLLAYVAPEFRFRGVTSTLLEKMEIHARAQHADRMSLTTTDTARAFFMARGYTPEEEVGDLFSEDQCTLLKEWPKE